MQSHYFMKQSHDFEENSIFWKSFLLFWDIKSLFWESISLFLDLRYMSIFGDTKSYFKNISQYFEILCPYFEKTSLFSWQRQKWASTDLYNSENKKWSLTVTRTTHEFKSFSNVSPFILSWESQYCLALPSLPEAVNNLCFTACQCLKTCCHIPTRSTQDQFCEHTFNPETRSPAKVASARFAAGIKPSSKQTFNQSMTLGASVSPSTHLDPGTHEKNGTVVFLCELCTYLVFSALPCPDLSVEQWYNHRTTLLLLCTGRGNALLISADTWGLVAGLI